MFQWRQRILIEGQLRPPWIPDILLPHGFITRGSGSLAPVLDLTHLGYPVGEGDLVEVIVTHVCLIERHTGLYFSHPT